MRKKSFIPEKSSLRYVLKKFMEMDWKGVSRSGSWHIANGGYDLWFELYYNNTPVADCVDGAVSVWGFDDYLIVNQLQQYIVDNMEGLKKINKNSTLYAKPDENFATLVQSYEQGDDYTTLLFECVIDKENNVIEVDKGKLSVRVCSSDDSITSTNYNEKLTNCVNCYVEDSNGNCLRTFEKACV